MWVVAVLIILPLSLILNKMCKRVKAWENMIGFFFFNGPLRIFVEMYLELIMQIIINTIFVKFKNFDQLVTTLTAFLFGTLALLLPFMAMTQIYEQRKKVNKT